MYISILYLVTAVLLGICILSFVYQSVRALRFRRNIADTHGFTEGIMTGIRYPILVISLCVLFIQFASFIFFRPSTELESIIRITAYIINFAFFFIIKRKVPVLLAYWFGKTAFWDNFGKGGKVPYTDIYCAALSRNVRFPMMNNQQLCKLSFYANGRTLYGMPRKFVCKMTAYELTALASQVEFLSHEDGIIARKERIRPGFARRALPFFKALTALSLLLVFFSNGIMYAQRFEPDNFDTSKEVSTVTEVTSVRASDSIVCVYYGKISAASVYGVDGEFLFSILLPYNPISTREIAVTDENICYRTGNTVYVYNSENGTLASESDFEYYAEVFASGSPNGFVSDTVNVYKNTDASSGRLYLVKRDIYCYAFSSLTGWTAFVLFLTITFILSFMSADRSSPSCNTVATDPDSPSEHTEKSEADDVSSKTHKEDNNPIAKKQKKPRAKKQKRKPLASIELDPDDFDDDLPLYSDKQTFSTAGATPANSTETAPNAVTVTDPQTGENYDILPVQTGD